MYVSICFYSDMICDALLPGLLYCKEFFNNNASSFWCCYSWPIAAIFKFVPVPEKQFQTSRKPKPKRVDSKQANTELPGKSLVESMLSC